MFADLRFSGLLVALVCIAAALMTNRASAVTVDVAKNCNALTAKAFPPREAGNPAAGSTKGTGKAQRDYFRKCVADADKKDDDTRSGAK